MVAILVATNHLKISAAAAMIINREQHTNTLLAQIQQLYWGVGDSTWWIRLFLWCWYYNLIFLWGFNKVIRNLNLKIAHIPQLNLTQHLWVRNNHKFTVSICQTTECQCLYKVDAIKQNAAFKGRVSPLANAFEGSCESGNFYWTFYPAATQSCYCSQFFPTATSRSPQFNFQFSSLSPSRFNLMTLPPLWRTHISYSSHDPKCHLTHFVPKWLSVQFRAWLGFKINQCHLAY